MINESTLKTSLVARKVTKLTKKKKTTNKHTRAQHIPTEIYISVKRLQLIISIQAIHGSCQLKQ